LPLRIPGLTPDSKNCEPSTRGVEVLAANQEALGQISGVKGLATESRYREMGYGPSDYPFVCFFKNHRSITGFLVVLVVLLLCMLSDGE